jgi:glycolate oxidase iron-sulfur subunit
MQTNLIADVLNTPEGQEADSILRACVHCGFCTATCPTYQILGDELDGPRGRIYQIKLALEGQPVTKQTQVHLDRCLTCLNCETTCPSGVRYHRLLDIGRDFVEQRVSRGSMEQGLRWLLRQVLPYSKRVTPLVTMGRWLKPLLPGTLARKIPPAQQSIPISTGEHSRKMLILAGCVQPAMTPRTNQAAANALNRLGIGVIEASAAGCCGALSHHLNAGDEAKDFMRRNIDAWWPYIEQGVEAIIMTASGCGSMVKEYATHLQHDKNYADKAKRVSELTRDLCEVLTADDMRKLATGVQQSIAFHPPCTLQHGQQLSGRVEALLTAAGFNLVPVKDTHLCCGSAGTYSLLQPVLSSQLKQRKLDTLQASQPELIVTANVGCQLHLQTDAGVPVKHWIELLA